jgi:hypothetical protein
MEKRGQHGILYRGASGDLWFLRDDWGHPRRFNDDRVKAAFSAHAEKKPVEDFMGTDLPEDILELLKELGFGPLIGAWWVWGP